MDIVHVNHPSKKGARKGGQNDYDDDDDEVRPIIQPVRQAFSWAYVQEYWIPRHLMECTVLCLVHVIAVMCNSPCS